jgi:hypothetical protein
VSAAAVAVLAAAAVAAAASVVVTGSTTVTVIHIIYVMQCHFGRSSTAVLAYTCFSYSSVVVYMIIILLQAYAERNSKIVYATTELYLMLTFMLNTTIVHILT